MSTKIQNREEISTDLDVKPPTNYKIMLLNNDKTAIEAVLDVLAIVFQKKPQDALRIAATAHRSGRSLVHAPFTKEMAQAKIEQTKFYCKQKDQEGGSSMGFPLNYSLLQFESEEE
jgi:ATP-dependent Clp protease adaptor protein ClpS